MTNFKAYVEINGAWEEITPSNSKCSGQPVFPLNYGQMLDERLNEAYLHIRKCSVPNFHPDTEFRIDVIENARTASAKTTSFNYIVARDNAIERPIGSGLYRHEIYLIERTKKLEGIICQSITFTNPKGNVYTDVARDLPPDITTTPSGTANFNTFYIQQYQSVIPHGKVFDTVSTKDIFKLLKENLRGGESYDISYDYSHVIVTKDGNQTDYRETNDTYDQGYEITADANQINIEYIITATYFGSGMTPDDITIRVKFVIGVASNRYPLHPYTIADCIDRCLLLAEPRFGNELPRYFLDPTQREKYEKIYAPQFSMTQCTLREQLKVIGGYIHAEPRLLGGDETVLIDGNEIKNNRLIHFDDLGAGEEWTPTEPYVFNQQSQDINEYCTSVDTSAANIINTMDYAQGVIYSPNNTDVLTVRTESVYARVNEENGFAYTQFPIYDVVKVECGVFKENEEGFFIEPVDITPYVFEEAEYTALLSSFSGTYPNAKEYAIYFKRGASNIRGLFFKTENPISEALEYFSIVNILSAVTGKSVSSIRNEMSGTDKKSSYASGLCFRISYIPYYSTRFSHGKPYVEDKRDEFSKIYNQSENLIETRYYGENIKGVAARLGNVEQTRTYRLSSLASVPQIGQTVDGYAISAVNVSVLPVENMGIKVTVALSKDFNRISQYVGIQSRKRTYEVSEAEAYQRNVLIREYCVVGNEEEKYDVGIFRHQNALVGIFYNDDSHQITPIMPISAASSCRAGMPGTGTLLPVVSSSFGNVMTFSWSYKDNYSAGDALTYQQLSNANGYYQNHVPYCDYYGRISEYSFNLLASEHYEDGATRDEALALPKKEYVAFSGSDGISTDFSEIGAYKMLKDSREVINMNFSLEFKSNMQSLIIGSALAANCPLVRNMEGQVERFTPLLYALDRKIGKFDQRITDSLTDGTSVFVAKASSSSIYIEIPESFENVTAWAICLPQTEEQKIYDKDGSPMTVKETTGGDIILACNDPAKFWAEAGAGDNGSRRIYLNLARNIYN